ncbi:M48 family metallopeptidase [Congregibacter litoralis]|uniref:Peptidase family M48 n=1 Tax=Congregibacter litoralis KT71 TaxID=314285 RepID=A4ABL3_9GAMM|nr:M48 family metallopeptidase [Congregibacter litoralis]EAQ96526.1 Peptidase family M48 [Congregibacter litoralis KT71]
MSLKHFIPQSNTLRNAAVIALLLTAVTACTTSPTGRSQFMLISPESAIVESRQAYLSTVGQLNKEDKLVDDPRMADRVATITGRLVTEAIALYPDSADWEWSVAIIDDDETVNAWCMAGGRMAAYTGLFEQLQLTDDEFAQIMGHEISHALANHTAERMSRAMAINVGVLAAGVASDNHVATLAGAALAAKLALELPNSRVAESEADEIGIELATRAGYAPEAAVSLWQKMGGLSESRPAEFLSTHPAPENRQAALSALVPEMRALNPQARMAKVTPITIVR